MVDTPTNCLDAEVLAAYVDRGLSLAERSRVDRHLASCPQCLALVAGVVRTVAEVPEFTPHAGPVVETAPRTVTRRTLVGVLAAAAAVLVVLFSPSLMRRGSDRDTGLVSLVGVGEERSVLGRLTGGFPHAPLVMPTAGGQVGTAAQADRILLTAAKIRESFGERETPARLHELGLTQLLAGRHDEAALSLLAASREQPANARYLNDVAAVQLERARLGLRPDDLPRALASADRARRLDPSLNEAWFNRALAATALSLNDQARQAWTDYLARDGSSAWAAEARTRLQELSKPTPADAWAGIARQLEGEITPALAEAAVRAQMTEARNLVETQLLAAWAAAVEGGRDASRELNGLRNFGQAFAVVAGDQLYRDAVTAIDRAGSDEQLRALARGHAAYAAAAALFAEDRFADAAPGLAAAHKQLSASASPFADRAALDLSTVFYVSGKANEAAAMLDAVGRRANESSYAYNGARSTWIKGLIAFGRSRLAEAQFLYEQTLAGFERMGDAEQTAFVHNLLGNLYYYLGDRPTEWHHRLTALNGLSVTGSHRVRHAILGTTAASLRVENPETALAIQDAVLRNAQGWGRDAAISEVRAQRAATLLSLGRPSEADRELQGARSTLAKVPDPQFRNRIEVALLATEGEILLLRSPVDSVAAVTRAISLVEERRDRLRLAQLHLQLAKANIVWGNLVNAQAALDRGIRVFEDERATLSGEGRISTLDESWRLFETAVHLALKNGDEIRAFALSESARTRTEAEAKRTQPHSLADVQQSLQPDEALVTLNQFDNELVVWVIKRHDTTVVYRPLTRADAARLVARQQDEIRHEAMTPDASADLYNEIIRPVTAQLQGIQRLAIVPDPSFGGAAFAAFWDRSSRQFLLERHHISVAPSASAFFASPARGSREVGTPLIIGGPNADSEARAIATAYANAEVQTGNAAARSRFLVPSADRPIVHIAARTMENAAYPLLSRVVLADDDGQAYSGAVMGRDIAGRPLSRTRVVVIDSASAVARSNGAANLTRAFLVAGAPAVLAALPGADENATRQLMLSFHRLMATGISADEALNQLQRNVLHSNGRRLGAWSALVLYGSDR
ncbi:MAG: CHAT domain-containing protein [Vicinamibacterales bacterium]